MSAPAPMYDGGTIARWAQEQLAVLRTRKRLTDWERGYMSALANLLINCAQGPR